MSGVEVECEHHWERAYTIAGNWWVICSHCDASKPEDAEG